MEISVSDAQSKLSELVRRAEAGDEIILTLQGKPSARIIPIKKKPLTPEERGRVIEAARASGMKTMSPGPSAARSQDFLYDDDGLPA